MTQVRRFGESINTIQCPERRRNHFILVSATDHPTLYRAFPVLLALLREAEDDDVNCVLSKLVQLYPQELVPHAETLTHHLVGLGNMWDGTLVWYRERGAGACCDVFVAHGLSCVVFLEPYVQSSRSLSCLHH